VLFLSPALPSSSLSPDKTSSKDLSPSGTAAPPFFPDLSLCAMASLADAPASVDGAPPPTFTPRPSWISRLLQVKPGADRPTRAADDFHPAYPHGALVYVGGRNDERGDRAAAATADAKATGLDAGAAATPAPDGVWTVRGTFVAGGPLQISRTMTVIRSAGRLTILNAMRLNEAGETALAALGPVACVVRLGGWHGVDDEYYRRTHGAALYALGGMRLAAGAAPAEVNLVPTAPAGVDAVDAAGDGDGDGAAPPAVPVRGAGVALLPTPYPEAVMYVPHLGPPGGLLLMADTLVHLPISSPPPYLNWLSGAINRWVIASTAPLRVVPLWLRAQVDGGVDGTALRAAYGRLGGWGAGGVITAHGDAWTPEGGVAAVAAAVAEAVAAALPA